MRRPLTVLCALGVAAWFLPQGRAAELVTLSNGFQMRCDHHAAANGHVRLYMNAGVENYIELAPEEITTVEPVADVAAPAPQGGAPDAAPPVATATRLTSADLDQMLVRAGEQHNVDVDLLVSIVHAESGGNPMAVSRAGARGLMQLMPSTAASLGVSNSFQPRQNVSGGSAYLDHLLTRYGNNLALALAAYNAGPEAVDRYHGVPPYAETRAYVARVIHEFNRRVLARQTVARRPTRAVSQK